MIRDKMDYKTSGVDIDSANSTKAAFKDILSTSNPRVLNQIGAFASLCSLSGLSMEDPVLVMKTEEPGSKQLLAFEFDRFESICFDMINHLVNDCIMMGAHPLIVQDCIVCGEMQKDKIKRRVTAMTDACKMNGCTLVGGETSEQPGVIPVGTYILSSSIVGVVDRKNIIDGSKIKEGDEILAISSSGPHTNGYSLIRAILKAYPELKNDGEFIFSVLITHRHYYQAIRGVFPVIMGLAHITGGGIKENLDRILPQNLSALIYLDSIKILDIFRKIKEIGDISDAEMLRTFNLGVGVAVVVSPDNSDSVLRHLSSYYNTYKIGKVIKGNKTVETEGTLYW
jgi:phosphoribosylformylglycinamidine cyclo-ligase